MESPRVSYSVFMPGASQDVEESSSEPYGSDLFSVLMDGEASLVDFLGSGELVAEHFVGAKSDASPRRLLALRRVRGEPNDSSNPVRAGSGDLGVSQVVGLTSSFLSRSTLGLLFVLELEGVGDACRAGGVRVEEPAGTFALVDCSDSREVGFRSGELRESYPSKEASDTCLSCSDARMRTLFELGVCGDEPVSSSNVLFSLPSVCEASGLLTDGPAVAEKL